MRIKTENITLDGTDMTSNILGSAIWLGHIANYAIQLVFTGDPDGTFKLQGSCDEPKKSDEANSVPTNWSDIANTSQVISEAGNHMWTASNVGYTFVRVVWTDSASGASAITSARFMVKGM